MMQDPASKLPAMNQLKPSTVYIPTPIKDRIVIPLAPEVIGFLYITGNLEITEAGNKIYTPVHQIGESGGEYILTGLLKQQSLYCFTREELEKIINDAWEAGHKPFVNKPKLSYVKQLLP